MVTIRNITRFFLCSTLAGLLAAPSGNLFAADIQTPAPEPTQQPAPPTTQKWRKKKKKKPTILQSWKKVITLDWDNITPHDERNLIVSATCAAVLYSCYYVLTNRSVVQTERPGANPAPDIDNIQDNESPPVPKPCLWAEKTRTAPLLTIPCIGQQGLTCGNHAFINTRDVLTEIAKNPAQVLTADHMKIVLCTEKRAKEVVTEISDHDHIVGGGRQKEIWRNYIRANIKSCIPHRSLIEIFFSFWNSSKKSAPSEHAINDLTNIIFDQTHTEKKTIHFCAENALERTNEIAHQLKQLINQKVFDPEKDIVNTARKNACLELVTSLDLNAWYSKFSHAFVYDDTTLKKAIAASAHRSRDLGSDEIRMLIERSNLHAPFEVKFDTSLFARDDNNNIIPNDTIIDDQKIEFKSGNAADMNGKIHILERGIRTIITGRDEYYLIKALKQAYATRDNFSFGFILRETDPSQDYEKIKSIEQNNPENRQKILSPLLTERAERSMTHWISVVLHRVNGVNHYYVTDSMDSDGHRDNTHRNSIKILIEALETDNHY